MIDVLPMIKAPSTWPTWLVGAVAMLLLAALDLVGAVAAKEWATRAGVVPFAVGAAAFLALFWVYASVLQYAELALVTLGWIVVLQVGLVLIDRLRYSVQMPTGKWVAIVVIPCGAGLPDAGSSHRGRHRGRRRGLNASRTLGPSPDTYQRIAVPCPKWAIL